MNIQYYELADNRWLGLDLFEISSLPNKSNMSSDDKEAYEKLAREFEQMLEEIHRLLGDNTCIELLWITDEASNQTFRSYIRLFFVIRKIGNSKEAVEYSIKNTKAGIMSALLAIQFGADDSEAKYSELMDLVSDVSSESVFSVAKSEKCISNSNSFYPYYYMDVIPRKNLNGFQSLINTISQYRNCCISFQLFPTSLNEEEAFILNEATGELNRIASGTMINRQIYRDALATEPLKSLAYYNGKRSGPAFLYNILVFGDKAGCAGLATKIISLIQSGEEKISSIDPICLDLTSENIDLLGQFSIYPWNINTRLLYYYRNRKLQETIPLANNLRRLQFMVTAEEAVSFFRLPLYEKTMASLKNTKISQAREQFTEKVVDENNVHLGELVSNDSMRVMIGCPNKSFTKHMLVVGTPGSGKTTFSVNLLLQFAKKKIPFLAIEPTKSEYRAMIEAIPDLRIFTPGNNAVSPYIINPFIPPKGIRIEQFIPSLVSAFKAAFSMPSPLDIIFLKAIRTCYIQYGWKDYSMLGDSDVQTFGLHEFILVFKQLIENTTYSQEVRGNIENAGLLRLTNLIEQNSNIYDTVNTVPIEDLLNAPTVLELNSIDNAEQKSLIIALLLINICIYTKHNQTGDGELKNIILIDEAHVLLGEGSPSAKGDNADSQGTTIKALQDMIAEIRSYGTGIIIADQSPTKVSREVVANTDIKVSFRLVQSAEKDLIADSTNMDDEAKANLSKLHVGQAYVYYSQLESPQMVMTEDIREKENIRLSVPDSEIAARITYWSYNKELLRPYKECEYNASCAESCDFVLRSNADYIANAAFEAYRSKIKTNEDYRKCVYNLDKLMKKELDKVQCEDKNRLIICSRIKFMRKVELELPLKLGKKDSKIAIMGAEDLNKENGE